MKIADMPKGLRSMLFHGQEMVVKGEQAVGDCLFCAKENKFYVNCETGLWDCKRCGVSGNPVTWLKLLWEKSLEETSDEEYRSLATDRGVLSDDVLRRWGCAVSSLTGEWLVPGYNHEGNLNTLYKYSEQKDGHRRLFVTSETNQGLMCPLLDDNLLVNPDCDTVFVTEGPWDGIVLWETLRKVRETAAGLILTKEEDKSLLATSSVISVPGCNVFNDHWARLFANKRVVILYDNDHPRWHCGNCKKSYSIVEHEHCPTCKAERHQPFTNPAGWEGVKKVCKSLTSCEVKPSEIHYLNWGEEGYDDKLFNGYDLRDALTADDQWKTRLQTLETLFNWVTPAPDTWLSPSGGEQESGFLPCDSWKTLVKTWNKAMKFHDGLNRALSFMLSIVTSTPLVGDQVWGRVISPPSGGKSQLCEGLCTCKKWAVPKSTLKGFHSGWRGKGDDRKDDHGEIPKIRNRTMVTKDADSLMKSGNIEQVLGQARDLYDGSASASYLNSKSFNHKGIRVTWLLCGTPKSADLDEESELGGRFLDCIISRGMTEENERNINMMVGRRVLEQIDMSVDGRNETDGPAMSEAKRMTGGYVNYLRENGMKLLSQVRGKCTDEDLEKFQAFADFISFMRARPSKKNPQDQPSKELSFRLMAQITKLSLCMAVVMNKDSVDGEIIRRVRHVALDSSRGKSLEIAKMLYVSETGMVTHEVAVHLGESDAKVREYLSYMRKLEIIVAYKKQQQTSNQPLWRLTPRVQRLYEEVIGD